MTMVTVRAAKTLLSLLIARVEAGEEVIIARRNKPVARLVAIEPVKPKRRFGSMKGKVWVGPDFFEPVPEAELRFWEGKDR